MASKGLHAVSRRPYGTVFRPRTLSGTTRRHSPPRRLSGQLPALRCEPPPAAPAASQPGSKRFARSSQSKRWLHVPNSSVHHHPFFHSSSTQRT